MRSNAEPADGRTENGLQGTCDSRLLQEDEDQSRGSTRTIEAPLLLPTHSTGRGPVSSRKTRRILVERGKRYSTNSPVVGSSRDTWSVSIEPVQTSFPLLLATAS